MGKGGARMLVLDAHVHLYPAEVNADPAGWAARAGEPHWGLLSTRVRRNGQPVQGFPSVGDLLRSLDEAGVDGALLLGWYWETGEACRMQNRFFAEVARAHPDRIQFFGTIWPGWAREDLEEELDFLGAAGCRGLGELSPHTQGHLSRWPEIFSRAGELGWPVNLHVTDPASRSYPGRVETPLDDFVGWARAYPATKYILAHWGGGLGSAAALAGLPNVWFDTAASPLLYRPEEEEALLAVLPWERVLWGTDHPLNLYPQSGGGSYPLRLLTELGRRKGWRAEMSGENLRQLLGLRA